MRTYCTHLGKRHNSNLEAPDYQKKSVVATDGRAGESDENDRQLDRPIKDVWDSLDTLNQRAIAETLWANSVQVLHIYHLAPRAHALCVQHFGAWQLVIVLSTPTNWPKPAAFLSKYSLAKVYAMLMSHLHAQNCLLFGSFSSKVCCCQERSLEIMKHRRKPPPCMGGVS